MRLNLLNEVLMSILAETMALLFVKVNIITEESNARNINTGQSVIIPKRKKIVFKASKKIKEKLYK